MAALSICALPASALAGTGVTTVAIPNNEQASVVAQCPAGERAVGGGFALEPANNTFKGEVFQSMKLGQRAWVASANTRFTTPNDPTTLTVIVYCSANAPKTFVKTSGPTLLLADGVCPRGTAVQAGGYLISNLLINPVSHYRIGRRTWRARIDEEAGSVESFAYCADAPRPRKRETTLIGNGSSTTPFSVIAGDCPRGTKSRAGGWFQPDFGGNFNPFIVHESLRVANGWQASARGAFSGADPSRFTTIGYCSG